MLQQLTDQRLVVGLHRPRKDPPTIPENEMPFPLRWIRPNRGFGHGASGWFSRRVTFSHTFTRSFAGSPIAPVTTLARYINSQFPSSLTDTAEIAVRSRYCCDALVAPIASEIRKSSGIWNRHRFSLVRPP